MAGPGVDGDHVHVERVHEERIAQHRQSAIHFAAAIISAGRVAV